MAKADRGFNILYPPTICWKLKDVMLCVIVLLPVYVALELTHIINENKSEKKPLLDLWDASESFSGNNNLFIIQLPQPDKRRTGHWTGHSNQVEYYIPVVSLDRG